MTGEDHENSITPVKSVRLRGGAGNHLLENPMIKKTIESARKHGINLKRGAKNAADGNCAFESVVENINGRQCFHTKLPLSITQYRQIWITDLENQTSKFPTLGAGYSKEQRCQNWNRLKQSGVYEIEFFGDLMLNAIARGSHKNILIFNTSPEAADPIYVVEAQQFGGFLDSEIPVVLGYNQVHYESFHPTTQEDIEKSKLLVQRYIDGRYTLSKKDIPFLISFTETIRL